jgi:hypothetical protein
MDDVNEWNRLYHHLCRELRLGTVEQACLVAGLLNFRAEGYRLDRVPAAEVRVLESAETCGIRTEDLELASGGGPADVWEPDPDDETGPEHP